MNLTVCDNTKAEAILQQKKAGNWSTYWKVEKKKYTLYSIDI